MAPLTCVLGRLTPPRTPRGTYLAELTHDAGLSHWCTLLQVLPRTPRLGGDRLGFFYGRLGGLGVGVSLLWRSRLAISSPDVRSQTAIRPTQTPITQILSISHSILAVPSPSRYFGTLRQTLDTQNPLAIKKREWFR